MRKGTIKAISAVALATATVLSQPLASAEVRQLNLFGNPAITVYAAEINPITVTVDGAPVNFPDAQPLIEFGRTLVPVRGVFEKLGYQVGWIPDQQAATLQQGETTLVVPIGRDRFLIREAGKADRLSEILDVPAKIMNGRTMLPLRAISEATGAQVDWNESQNLVSITTGAGEKPPVNNGDFADAPEGWEPSYLGGHIINRIEAKPGVYIYLGESLESAKEKIGVEPSEEGDSTAYSGHIYTFYMDQQIRLTSENGYIDVIDIGTGHSLAGYTVGDPWPDPKTLPDWLHTYGLGSGYQIDGTTSTAILSIVPTKDYSVIGYIHIYK